MSMVAWFLQEEQVRLGYFFLPHLLGDTETECDLKLLAKCNILSKVDPCIYF